MTMYIIRNGLIKMGTQIGSLKRIKTTLPMTLKITLSKLQEFLIEAPDTLEELTISRMKLCDEQSLHKLDYLLKEINELRSTRGTSNPLQINFFHERREGFDIDPKLY